MIIINKYLLQLSSYGTIKYIIKVIIIRYYYDFIFMELLNL